MLAIQPSIVYNQTILITTRSEGEINSPVDETIVEYSRVVFGADTAKYGTPVVADVLTDRLT
jgi:hypothetical protein